MKNPNPKSTKLKSPIIVGIGASAGGLEALQQFLAYLPEEEVKDYYAFVIVQHLSPDYKSLMVEILSKHTKLKVKQIENDVDVEAGTIYLNPPKNNIIYKNQKLFLEEYTAAAIHYPINVFLESIAENVGEQAIGIVLSGTGSDGTAGIRKIKECEGVAIVQDPKTAKFDGMPKNAIHTGLIDFILSPGGIAQELVNLMQTVYSSGLGLTDESKFNDQEVLTKIYQLLKQTCKIDFTYYKSNTIIRRINRRMLIIRKETLSDYLYVLENDPAELSTLGKEILIGVTNFFRDIEHFDVLQQIAVRDIVERTPVGDSIRVWSAGCSTGEEAYSIAILFDEIMEKLDKRCDVKIFATDVDEKAIEIASRGNYTKNIENDMSVERLLKYFSKTSAGYSISKNIRKMIIFAPHNVLQDPPFGKLDLISCRNLLIYFQQILQKNLFAIFHASLKNNGYLFLGKSETASEYPECFIPIAASVKLYQHNSFAKSIDLSLSTYSLPTVQPVIHKIEEKIKPQIIEHTPEKIHHVFLEKYLPPCVVINEKNEALHFYGNCDEFLKINLGEASLNIFTMVGNDLNLVLSTAINRCREEQKTITYSKVQVNLKDSVKIIDLIIDPILDNRSENTNKIAIIFSEQKTFASGEIETYDVNKIATQRIVDLERELRESKYNLKTSISELETVNEELQSANEELLTANEELQSSNEELQSVNEELYTVNTEYQQKVDELLEMSNDMSNFLSFTMIGILFVDSQMNIRKFTEYIGREFQLMEHDVGRPLRILSHSFPTANLIEDATEVMRTLLPIDREVVSSENKNYSLRITPYRTTDNIIKGLVITILDSFVNK